MRRRVERRGARRFALESGDTAFDSVLQGSCDPSPIGASLRPHGSGRLLAAVRRSAGEMSVFEALQRVAGGYARVSSLGPARWTLAARGPGSAVQRAQGRSLEVDADVVERRRAADVGQHLASELVGVLAVRNRAASRRDSLGLRPHDLRAVLLVSIELRYGDSSSIKNRLDICRTYLRDRYFYADVFLRGLWGLELCPT
jgi:hypothetical protein